MHRKDKASADTLSKLRAPLRALLYAGKTSCLVFNGPASDFITGQTIVVDGGCPVQ